MLISNFPSYFFTENHARLMNLISFLQTRTGAVGGVSHHRPWSCCSSSHSSRRRCWPDPCTGPGLEVRRRHTSQPLHINTFQAVVGEGRSPSGSTRVGSTPPSSRITPSSPTTTWRPSQTRSSSRTSSSAPRMPSSTRTTSKKNS